MKVRGHFSYGWCRLLTELAFIVAGDYPHCDIVLASTGPFHLGFALVRAPSRLHFHGSASGRGSDMRLPSHGRVSSPRLASPLPTLPYSLGSNASSFAAVALLALPASLTPEIPSARAGAVPATSSSLPRSCMLISAHSTGPT